MQPTDSYGARLGFPSGSPCAIDAHHARGSAYNGHFASVCYHPLFLFTDHGDCVAAKLRPGNVSTRRRPGTSCSCQEIATAADVRASASRSSAARRLRCGRRSTRRWRTRGVGYAIRIPGQQESGAWRSRTVTIPVTTAAVTPQGVRLQERHDDDQADSWTTARRVVAKVEHAQSVSCSRRVRLHRDESPAPESCRQVRFYNKQTMDGPRRNRYQGSTSPSRHTGRACRVTGSGRMSVRTAAERAGLWQSLPEPAWTTRTGAA